ncbi:hypothetical protein H310_05638 [Aphanomyces invadans]|uniref:Uncharacterized protein n=1 Tax=Aphanomyces invadans TaxID=157072 RepID=A0A024U9Z2_9STRA|nr:hypothetical protein H310_05638 [Aphanomyces invadans]ETW03241.1 hypothetical protein H310_05638 [Aphanomyces invadans]|eukprot:XP_008868625.1 hypothetical protein H310_05638 [Aphanomyces invadans]
MSEQCCALPVTMRITSPGNKPYAYVHMQHLADPWETCSWKANTHSTATPSFYTCLHFTNEQRQRFETTKVMTSLQATAHSARICMARCFFLNRSFWRKGKTFDDGVWPSSGSCSV